MMIQENFRSKTTLRAVIVLCLIVGSLDILSAIIDYYIVTGKNPSAIFKYIASALLGNKAFSGSAGTVLLGFILHYLIAFSFTILFVWLYVKTTILPKNKLITAILYGAFIWGIMNLIVIPLSSTPKLSFDFLKSIKALLILICMIGLPLSLLTEKFLWKKNST